MSLAIIAAVVTLGLFAGLLIGTVGIGGVVIVPMLVAFGGVSIHTAIPAALMSFLISGVVGTFVFWRERSIRWNMATWLGAAAMPGAVAGAAATSVTAASLLELAVALLTIASGIQALVGEPRSTGHEGRPLTPALLIGLGGVTGFASALTGTGGPLVLIPLLLWLDTSVLTSIGLAQAIQIPIALLATLTNAWTGTLDVSLGLMLGAGLVFGTWAGARLAHSVPRATLKTVVAWLLVAVGGLVLVKLLLGVLPHGGGR